MLRGEENGAVSKLEFGKVKGVKNGTKTLWNFVRGLDGVKWLQPVD